MIINNMKLLYRSSRDGFNYLSIVNKINNKSNLLFLYSTGKDRIFGAFIQTKLENIDNGKFIKMKMLLLLVLIIIKNIKY